MLEDLTNHVNSKISSTETKLTVVNMVAMSRIRYYMSLSQGSIQDMRGIELALNKFYRSQTKNMASFPTALLHIRKSEGGLGLHSAVDMVNLTKWKHMLRCINYPVTKDAMHSMVHR